MVYLSSRREKIPSEQKHSRRLSMCKWLLHEFQLQTCCLESVCEKIMDWREKKKKWHHDNSCGLRSSRSEEVKKWGSGKENMKYKFVTAPRGPLSLLGRGRGWLCRARLHRAPFIHLMLQLNDCDWEGGFCILWNHFFFFLDRGSYILQPLRKNVGEGIWEKQWRAFFEWPPVSSAKTPFPRLIHWERKKLTEKLPTLMNLKSPYCSVFIVGQAWNATLRRKPSGKAKGEPHSTVCVCVCESYTYLWMRGGCRNGSC